jgi:hypothetical protein
MNWHYRQTPGCSAKSLSHIGFSKTENGITLAGVTPFLVASRAGPAGRIDRPAPASSRSRRALKQRAPAPVAVAIAPTPLKLDPVTVQRGDLEKTVGTAVKLQLYESAMVSGHRLQITI